MDSEKWTSDEDIEFDLVIGGRGFTWSKPSPSVQMSYVPDPEIFETDMTVMRQSQKDDL